MNDRNVRRDVYRPLTPDEFERASRPGPTCLDCGHEAKLHEGEGDAFCLICPCDGLHLDVGDCTDECGTLND